MASISAPSPSNLELNIYSIADNLNNAPGSQKMPGVAHLVIPQSTLDQANCNTGSEQLIVVLDTSASMRSQVRRFVTTILPQALAQSPVQYGLIPVPSPTDQNGVDDDIDNTAEAANIHIVAFNSDTTTHHVTVASLPTSPLRSGGGTKIAPAFVHVADILQTLPVNARVRILTVSDGRLADARQASLSIDHLAATINHLSATTGLSVTAHALRLFTSTKGEPDTRALAHTMQLHQGASPSIFSDFQSSGSDDDLIATVVKMLISDISLAELVIEGLPVVTTPQPVTLDMQDSLTKTVCFAPGIARHCWQPSQTQLSLPLQQPNKTPEMSFWISPDIIAALQENPSSYTFSISSHGNATSIPIPITSIKSIATLTDTDYINVFVKNMDQMLFFLKLFMVSQAQCAVEYSKLVTNLFEHIDSIVFSPTGINAHHPEERTTHTDKNVRVRVADLKERLRRVQRGFMFRVNEIVNTSKVSSLNNAQAASFLRSSTNTATSRGLARRHGDNFDFGGIARSEAYALALAWSQLHPNDTNDDDEEQEDFIPSSISFSTTRDGIEALVQLASTNASTLEDMPLDNEEPESTLLYTLSALQIIEYFHITGIPISAPVGDFPDPSTYRVNALFPGFYCSISDIITGKQEHHDVSFPGFDKDKNPITNVIPIFENATLYQLIFQHAPRLLNYIASLGMRQMITDVSGTLQSIVTKSFIRMMAVVAADPSPVNVMAITHIYRTMQASMPNTYFQTQFTHLNTLLCHIAQSIEESSSQNDNQNDTEQEIVAKTTVSIITDVEIAPLSQLVVPLLTLYRNFIDGKIDQSLSLLNTSTARRKGNIVSAHHLRFLPMLLLVLYLNQSYVNYDIELDRDAKTRRADLLRFYDLNTISSAPDLLLRQLVAQGIKKTVINELQTLIMSTYTSKARFLHSAQNAPHISLVQPPIAADSNVQQLLQQLDTSNDTLNLAIAQYQPSTKVTPHPDTPAWVSSLIDRVLPTQTQKLTAFQQQYVGFNQDSTQFIFNLPYFAALFSVLATNTPPKTFPNDVNALPEQVIAFAKTIPTIVTNVVTHKQIATLNNIISSEDRTTMHENLRATGLTNLGRVVAQNAFVPLDINAEDRLVQLSPLPATVVPTNQVPTGSIPPLTIDQVYSLQLHPLLLALARTNIDSTMPLPLGVVSESLLEAIAQQHQQHPTVSSDIITFLRPLVHTPLTMARTDVISPTSFVNAAFCTQRHDIAHAKNTLIGITLNLALLQANDINEFNTILTNGVTIGSVIGQYTSVHDIGVAALWQQLCLKPEPNTSSETITLIVDKMLALLTFFTNLVQQKLQQRQNNEKSTDEESSPISANPFAQLSQKKALAFMKNANVAQTKVDQLKTLFSPIFYQ